LQVGNGSGLQQAYINGNGYDLYLGASGGTAFGFASQTATLVFNNTAVPFALGTLQSQPLAFGTAGFERLRIDSSGNVGIGTATPGALLDVLGSSDTVLLSSNATNSTTKEAKIQCRHYTNAEENLMLLYGFSTSTDNNIWLGGGASAQNAATNIVFATATNNTTTSGTERARIDSSGRLLVGTSSSRSWSGINSQFQIENVGVGAYASQSIIANSNDTTGGLLVLGKSRGTSLGSDTAVQNNDLLGRIYFYGADGSALVQGATIESWVDGTPGANDMPGRLVFSTTADGASSPTERMRITNDAKILFNSQNTSFSGGDFGHVFFPFGEAYYICDNAAAISINRSNDGNLIQFYTGNTSPVNQGNISVSGSTITYGAFLGSHWGRLLDQSKPNIPVGTVLEVVDKLIDWKVAVFTVDQDEKVAAYAGSAKVGDIVTIEYEGNFYDAVVREEDPQKDLNKHVYVKVSDTPGSKAVFGVFLGWDDDTPPGMVNTWNDLNIGALGNYFVRMAPGQTPEIGDLVESDGTGCAIVQDDDIVRTKTVAKITSTISQITYDDGSFLVTCVLYCG
jgi:hypothetical protein